ncbi:hypothetical protein A2U01_0117732, partial [Trifolium medium]|nr:hypothetical protein [Trifolium medium]
GSSLDPKSDIAPKVVEFPVDVKSDTAAKVVDPSVDAKF